MMSKKARSLATSSLLISSLACCPVCGRWLSISVGVVPRAPASWADLSLVAVLGVVLVLAGMRKWQRVREWLWPHCPTSLPCHEPSCCVGHERSPSCHGHSVCQLFLCALQRCIWGKRIGLLLSRAFVPAPPSFVVGQPFLRRCTFSSSRCPCQYHDHSLLGLPLPFMCTLSSVPDLSLSRLSFFLSFSLSSFPSFSFALLCSGYGP